MHETGVEGRTASSGTTNNRMMTASTFAPLHGTPFSGMPRTAPGHYHLW